MLLPGATNVDANRIKVKFDMCMLKISLPKTAAAIQEERKIDVKAA